MNQPTPPSLAGPAPSGRQRLLAAAVAVGLGAVLAIVVARSLGSGDDAGTVESGAASGPTSVVEGRVGSEKIPLLDDERMAARLAELGFDLDAREAGSREISVAFDLSQLDFTFPSGVAATRKIEAEAGPDTHEVTGTFDVFFSPMVIASWQPIVDILVANGLAADQGGWYSFDVEAYLALLETGTRWSELDANDAFDVDKQVLVRSTDFRTSNSAAMYLALLSYEANGSQVVSSGGEVVAVADQIESAFRLQGFMPASSQQAFDPYLVEGMGSAPLVMIYEAQFLAEAFSPSSNISDDMVLLYPTPTVFSQHTVVAHTEEGRAFGAALDDDPELATLAAEYGFRGADDDHLGSLVEASGIEIPDVVVDVVDPPAYDYLEGMIVELENR